MFSEALQSQNSFCCPNLSEIHCKRWSAFGGLSLLAVVGSVILLLGALFIFGPIGSISYIASLSAGGVTALAALIGILVLAKVTCKKQTPSQNEPKSSSHEGAPSAHPIQEIAKKSGCVCFYLNGPTAFLSNSYECPQGIRLWGRTFKCAESAFQWRKFYLAGIEHKRYPLLRDSLLQQFYICEGQAALDLSIQIDQKYGLTPSDWHRGGKEKEMWTVLQAKFTQNPELKSLLDMTGSTYLLEHSNQSGKDAFWSDNHDGTGKNVLGRMLMAMRDGKETPAAIESTPEVMQWAAVANAGLNYEISP